MSVFQKTFFSGSGVEAILAFVIGVFFCFAGYKQARRVIPAGLAYMGFIAGLWFMGKMIHNGLLDCIAAFVLAAAAFILGVFVPSLGLGIFTMGVFYDLTGIFLNHLPARLIIGAVLGIAAVILTHRMKREPLIGVTSVCGAVFIMQGIFGLLGVSDRLVIRIFWVLITAVVAAIGAVSQVMLNGKNKARPKKQNAEIVNI
ncbi:MAG: hypothetical protein II186_08135 [Erysipelotrichales bacterium]|nr:hypothetical protein [Erysipelotrichales bacterium]